MVDLSENLALFTIYTKYIRKPKPSWDYEHGFL